MVSEKSRGVFGCFRKNQGEFLGGFGKIEGSFWVVSEKSRGVFSRMAASAPVGVNISF